MTGGFLLAVIAAVLAIVIAAPKYAEPAAGAGLVAVASDEPVLDAAGAEAAVAEPEVTLSKSPDQLKGYRWPVKGGYLDTFYQHDRSGRFEIEGKRVHDGIIITWFEGALVKAAHAGKVVYAGREWARHAGYDGSLDELYERLADRGGKGKKQRRSALRSLPLGVVIKDGNGYYSIYTELKDLRVKAGEKVKLGQPIGEMSLAEGKAMMRYRLVRMDGEMMKVHESDRKKGYPGYARERVDPLAVFNIDAKRRPKRADRGPEDPPRLSSY